MKRTNYTLKKIDVEVQSQRNKKYFRLYGRLSFIRQNFLAIPVVENSTINNDHPSLSVLSFSDNFKNRRLFYLIFIWIDRSCRSFGEHFKLENSIHASKKEACQLHKLRGYTMNTQKPEQQYQVFTVASGS